MSHRNLLMISIDDIRPLMGCYGHPEMPTPNIDRLAAEGIRFSRAYCQVPICGASRASLLTGVRPARNRFLDYFSRADEEAPHTPVLLHTLKKHGYTLAGNTKVFHDPRDHADCWDDYLQSRLPGFPEPFYSERGLRLREQSKHERNPDDPPHVNCGPSWECADVDDEAYRDGEAVQYILKNLQRFARDDRPFMAGFGSTNVHLPFKAPKKYWDQVDPDSIELPSHRDRPPNVPDAALHPWPELRNYTDIPKEGPLDDDTARTLIHGYRAGILYLDAQIGKILDEVERLGLEDSTTVVLWADHGFNLGEHGLWCKHCLYETSLQVPLIIRPAADAEFTPGTVVDTVVENLDVFPTICDLLDLDPPNHLQGRSLVPLMKNPDDRTRGVAVSRFQDGETIRTDRYRYAEWRDDAGEVYARTLFDHETDPGEERNLAPDPDYAELIRELSARLAEYRDLAERVSA